LRARRRAAEAPLRAFLTTIQRSADLALRLHDPYAARCALAGLVRWAQAGAWLGEMRQKQAAYQRNWDLAGAALAYLKVRRFASAHERGVIEPWLLRWAHANAAFFARKGVKRNNHVYWMGLGALATGLATQQPALIARAREVMHEAAGAIRDDGALPLELARGSRALHYHAFALTPLTLMAELAARGLGEDWYALERGAVHRLTALTASALERPSTFAALTGTRPHRATKPGYGWLYLYRARHPGRLAGVALDIPTHHRWLGGDVRLWRLWRPAR
ncbi:MAG: alginate lyase family protein, partial [Pseudomonadota bacterium]